jgi:hypothetical protein
MEIAFVCQTYAVWQVWYVTPLFVPVESSGVQFLEGLSNFSQHFCVFFFTDFL